MKTHIITILVYLHNTKRTRSRGALADAQVRFKIQKTVFPQKRVKVSKFQIEKSKKFRVMEPHNFDFWIIFDADSNGLVRTPKFKIF